jgi:hypothetical protein
MRKTGVVYSVGVGAILGVLLAGSAAAQTTTSVSSINFGNVALNEVSASRLVTVKNIGASAVTVSAVVLSGSSDYSLATAATTCANGTTLARNASCNVAVVVTPASLGSLPAGSLTIATNASNPTEPIALSGTGIEPTALSASSMGFGNVALDETSASRTVTLYNYQLTPLTISSVTVPTEYAISATTCGTTLAASSNCTISLTLTPTSLGAVPSGSLTVQTNAANSPLSTTLSGTGVQPSALIPASVGFGNVPLNETSAAKTVTLYNYQLTPLTISSVTVPTGYAISATTCGTTLAASSNCTISLTLTPTSLGAVPSGSLTVQTNAANSPLSTTLSGTGVQPSALIPASVGFGNAVINEASASRTVTLYNYQLFPITLSAPNLPRNYTLMGTTCGSTLAAQSSCTYSLVLTPTALGTVPAGSFSVATNTVNSPLSATLSGTGVPATTLSTTNLNLGNAVVGTVSATKLLTIHNQSSGSLSLTQLIFNGPFALDTTSAIANECPIPGGALSGTLPALSSCAIGITFNPTVLGATAGGKVTILDTDPSGPVSAALGGTGVAPTTLSPTSVNFGNVVENTTSATKSVTFTNYQSVALNFTSIAVPAPYALATGANACAVGTPLAPSNGCSIYVNYSPAGLGSAPASQLTVQDDAASGTQTLSTALAGKGIPPISTNTTTLSFGNVVLGESSTKTFTFTNNQTTSTTITSITGPSGAYALNPSATTCAISPATVGAAPMGNTCIVSVTFTPTELGSQLSSLVLNDTSSIPAVTVNVTGNGTAPVSLSPASLNFPAQTEGLTSTPLTSKLTNLQNIPLNIASATILGADPNDFLVTTTCPTSPASLPAAKSCSLSVTFAPTASGTRTATLSISEDATSVPLTIPLTGGGNAPVLISPTTITNFSANVGTTSRASTITIKNAQAATPLHIARLQLSGDFVQSATTCPTTPAALAPLASCNVSVQFAPVIGGTRNGQLQLDDDAVTSPQVVNLSGTGTSPLTISPGSLSFSSQLLNTTRAAKTITLLNHETQPETFTLSTTGDYAASSNCASGSIAANSSCLIYVHFTPSSVTPATRAGTLSIANSAAIGSLVVANLTGSAISTPPGAAVAVVSPGAGSAGTAVPVVITGNGWTHFNRSSVISFVDENSSAYANDVTVISQTYISANQINATLQLAGGSNVVYGARNITVKTPLTGGGMETASLLSAFIISDPSNAHSITAATPNFGTQGQTLDVALQGVGTHWIPGTTYANFGDGITVNSLTVSDALDAMANITISNTTPVGFRTITLVTGGEFDVSVLSPQGNPLFQVQPNNATLVSVSPNSEAQGLTGQVTLNAAGTHFLQNATTVAIGGAIVGDVNVLSPLVATAQVAVPAGAPLGPQSVTVATGGEVASLANGFTITGSTPALVSVSPSSGQQGQSLNVVVTGNSYANFVAGQVSAEFDGNIQSGPVTVIPPNQVTIPISISGDANVGTITANLLSGPMGSVTLLPFSFTVMPSSAAIVSVTPSSVPQGGQLPLAVVGQNTSWVQGTTTAAFYPQVVPTPSIDLIAVADNLHASLNVAVPTTTPPGTYPFYMATGGQIVNGDVTVYANTPSLTMSPANGMVPNGTAPNSFTVNFSGHFTHFSTTDTVPVISGEGVTLSNFNVTSLNSASATISIAPGSPIGARKVTFTTGDEIVVTYFNVTSTPVEIINVIPYAAPQNATLNVEIFGLNTHFTQGVTQVLFGPQITVNNVTVNSPTDLVANITTSYLNESVPSVPAPGWQALYVNTVTSTGNESVTANEQVLGEFDVSAPATPAVVSVVPSSAQQGSTVDVTITGSLTSWGPATEAILGAGVTVSNLTVVGPTSATATLAISPTAPVGGNTVTLITGTEIESGAGFSVTPGAASILSVEPDFTCPPQALTSANFQCSIGGSPTSVPVVAQLQTITLNIVGVGTHWLQGATTLS